MGGEKIDLLSGIWGGYWQGSGGQSQGLALVGLDLAIVALVSYWLIGYINTRRALGYFGIIASFILIVVVTSYIALPGLRFMAGVSSLVMIIAWPLIFRNEWERFFGPKTPPSTEMVDSSLVLALVPAPVLGRMGRAALAVVFTSVVLAFTLGQAVRVGELSQKLVITAVKLADGTSANLGNQTQVSVIVSAERQRFSVLDPQELTATVDVGGKVEGTHELPVSVSSPDSTIKIVRFRPERVTVKIEPIISKTVGLVAKFSGRANDDLVPDEPRFEPDRVEISGPKSVVTDIIQLVVPVNIAGLSGVIEQKFAPVGLNSAGEIIGNLIVKPKEVTGKIALVKAGKIKTVGV
ncbi:MAG: CdaR family protein, partial [Patescibacteria group bacterium]